MNFYLKGLGVEFRAKKLLRRTDVRANADIINFI